MARLQLEFSQMRLSQSYTGVLLHHNDWLVALNMV